MKTCEDFSIFWMKIFQTLSYWEKWSRRSQEVGFMAG